MFAISVMSMYWIGGTKFSVDQNDAVRFASGEAAFATIPLIPIQHQMQVVALGGEQPQQSVVDLADPGYAPQPAPPSAAPPSVAPPSARAPAQQRRRDIIGTKTGRQGQVVNIAGHVPNTQPVTWTPGMPIHRLNPNRTGGPQDHTQKNWGKAKGAAVAGMSEDGSVTDPSEFGTGQQVDPLS